MTVLLPAISATRSALATLTFTFGSSTETVSLVIVTVPLFLPDVETCTTAEPGEMNALVVFGKSSFISLPSTKTTYSSAFEPFSSAFELFGSAFMSVQ